MKTIYQEIDNTYYHLNNKYFVIIWLRFQLLQHILYLNTMKRTLTCWDNYVNNTHVLLLYVLVSVATRLRFKVDECYTTESTWGVTMERFTK